MLFKRLFQPKWGKAASENMDAPALDAADPGTRRQACKATADLQMLRQIATDDLDAGVREFAAARLRNLLAGGEPDSPDTRSALAFLEETADPSLATHLARDAADPQLRQAVVAITDDTDTLYGCALQDPVAAVRLAAAQRLDDKSALERLAKKIGRKDKNVLREVRGKLKLIAEREQEPERRRQLAEELCQRVERLGRHGSWSQDQALLAHSDREWRDIEADIPLPLAQRYHQAREAFLQLLGEHQAEKLALEKLQQDQQQLLAQKQALVDELAALDPQQATDDELHSLTERWDGLAPLPEEQGRQQRKEWERLLRQQKDSQVERRHLAERGQRLLSLCDQGRAWSAQSHPLQKKALQQWMDQGGKLATSAPEDETAREFEQLREDLTTRMERQIEHAEQKLQALPERLELLQRELEQGSLKPATALHQSIRADLDLCRASGLAKARCDQADTLLHQLTPRLRELQNWRKWGTDQHRQELLQAMQALERSELPEEQLLERVQELQQQWKSLDHTGSPVNEGLWKRFHQAADAAFERCKPFLEQQAEQREANRQAREALCRKLEDFLAQVDWDNVDWKKAARAEREIRAEWAELGEVAPKQRKALDRRYHKAMKGLDQHLTRERAANKSLKQDLIEQAKGLIEEPDLDKAIRDIKSLQKQWHTTVPSRRKQENQLWQHFRETCDQVFARRDASRDAHRRQQQDAARGLGDLCGELEGLRDAAGTDPDDLLRRLHELQGRWREASRQELPPREADRLQRRWQDAGRQVQGQVEALRHTAERQRMETLALAAALCKELENGIQQGSPGPATAESWERRWQDLGLAEDSPAGLRQRFDTALAASADEARRHGWLEELKSNDQRRAEICLRMEILAGIDSPAEAARERLALQVNRLAEHLGEGENDPLASLPRLEMDWYESGPASIERDSALESRFQRALKAALSPRDAAGQGSGKPR
jgi:exonuclease SbcC